MFRNKNLGVDWLRFGFFWFFFHSLWKSHHIVIILRAIYKCQFDSSLLNRTSTVKMTILKSVLIETNQTVVMCPHFSYIIFVCVFIILFLVVVSAHAHTNTFRFYFLRWRIIQLKFRFLLHQNNKNSIWKHSRIAAQKAFNLPMYTKNNCNQK